MEQLNSINHLFQQMVWEQLDVYGKENEPQHKKIYTFIQKLIQNEIKT